MIKAGSFFRKTVVAQLEKALLKSDSIFVIGYSGLTSIQMTNLRTSLKQNQSRILVTKNSLMHKALKDSNVDGLDGLISGPTALVFSQQDIATIAKTLIQFAKAHQSLVLKGALSNQQIFDNKAIEALSRLPSKETLRAQVVMALKSPLAGLVFTLKGNLNKLVLVLNQIKDKKK
ncbi:MAG: 50S ribosomal protein L10 [Omnitrophica WOR_2 bacterium RIFCSPHIGHO2_02_FULL_45_21]|nr:MAG: 50S ribosomal protein L10 [Omnitrophica WOR_2 bacterium RIFCSPHIGHO2_02_FULL_45_21]